MEELIEELGTTLREAEDVVGAFRAAAARLNLTTSELGVRLAAPRRPPSGEAFAAALREAERERGDYHLRRALAIARGVYPLDPTTSLYAQLDQLVRAIAPLGLLPSDVERVARNILARPHP